ncbi:MAG: hypothetical protein U0414_33450 [Polyangiaceae bacterium]
MRGRAALLTLLVGVGVPLEAAADPTNATCETARVLSFPSKTQDSTEVVTTESLVSACGKNDPFAAWYRFTAPETGRYEAITTDEGELSDTTLAFLSSCGGDILGCNDDTLRTLFADDYVDLVAGQEVFVRVAGWARTRGSFGLTLAHPADVARPPNDACDDARTITTTARGSTLNATGTDSSSCGDSDASDIWFTFTAPSEDDYTFSLSQQMLAVNIVSIQTGCGTGELACGLATATAHLDAGQTVKIRVGTDPNAADQFNVNVSPGPTSITPKNDSWSTAAPIGSLGTFAGTTAGATEDALNFGPGCAPYVNDAVWFAFTAPNAGSYVFDTNGSDMEDTALAVFDACLSGNGGPPALLGCDDDGGEGKHSRIEGTMPAGGSICLAVAGHYLDEHGGFKLNVSAAPGRPPNDHCAGALPLELSLTQSGENYGSEPEALGDDACPGGEFALWYTFTAPEDGDFKFDTKLTTDAEPGIALYVASSPDGCNGPLEKIACSEDPNPAVTRTMSAGEQVWIRVGTNVFTRGPIAVRVGPKHTPEIDPSSTSSTSSSSSSGAGGGGGGAGGKSPAPDGCDCAVGSARGGADAPMASVAIERLLAGVVAGAALVFRRSRRTKRASARRAREDSNL